MHIVALEPLGVPADALNQIFAPLVAAGHRFDPCLTPLSVEEKKARAKDADVLIIANHPLPAEIIRAATKAKLLAVAFTGVDHVDLAACKAQGITVCNAQGYATTATAELSIGLMLAALRHLTVYDRKMRAGKTKEGYSSHTLKGRTVAILGTGAIGTETARLAQAFGAKVVAWNRSEHADVKALGIPYLSLEEALRQADIVSIHLPLNEGTRSLLDAKHLALLREGTILVNAGRGLVIDREALLDALRSGKLAHAALDMIDVEPPVPTDHPLLALTENTTLTPHIGFFTEESMYLRAEMVRDTVAAFLNGQPINVIQQG